MFMLYADYMLTYHTIDKYILVLIFNLLIPFKLLLIVKLI